MNKSSKIFIAGGTGLVGSAFLRKLTGNGYNNIIASYNSRPPVDEYSNNVKFEKINLIRQQDVESIFEKHKPEYVFLSAAKVGGIHANNTYKADFIYDNLMIASNVINCSYKYGVKKLLNLGSSCIYPKLAPQPMKEEYLLTGELEPTNEPYAIAKIAAIKLCRYFNEQYGTNFISVMPTNLYGPNDNYDLQNSHVLPALVRKFIEAKKQNKPEVVIWGSGKPYREFMHSDDLADACLFLMNNFDAKQIGEIVNIGTGTDVTITELANIIAEAVNYKGNIVYDSSKPDGTPKKLLNVERINKLGWKAGISLEDGIKSVIEKVVDEI